MRYLCPSSSLFKLSRELLKVIMKSEEWVLQLLLAKGPGHIAGADNGPPIKLQVVHDLLSLLLTLH
jgi:hypothetical protein